MFKSLILAALYLFLFLIFVSLWGFYSAIRPFKITSTTTPKDFNVPYEEISFRTQDNILLRGWFLKSPKPNAKTIILLHGYPADKGDILPARFFLLKDFNLLFFDFRYLGQSEGRYSTVGRNEVLDLLAAIEFLESRGIKEVGVWGFSLGGAVAIMTAAKSSAIKVVVAESSYARLDWMLDDYYRIPILRYPLGWLTRFWAWLYLGYSISDVVPLNAIKTLKIPILLLASKQDQVIPHRHTEALEAELRSNPRAKVIVVDEERHGEPIKDYQEIVRKFFLENLR